MEPNVDSVAPTRYARPCRPVKPLEMILLVGHTCVKQREHRKRDEAPERYVGGTFMPGLLLLDAVVALLVELASLLMLPERPSFAVD